MRVCVSEWIVIGGKPGDVVFLVGEILLDLEVFFPWLGVKLKLRMCVCACVRIRVCRLSDWA